MSREVHNFCSPEAFAADRLIAVEVITPGGNWSSYPPHKHDEEIPGVETALEEIYYFEVADGGFAYQRAYGPGVDILEEVRSGDHVLLPSGYHGPVDGRARLRPLLPQRDGRARRARVALHRRPGPRVDPGHLGRPGGRPAAADDGEVRRMRLTVAQALVRFLANQYSERDGVEQRLIAGCFGIFGHGNVAGVGQALLEQRDEMPYVLARNEQAMVHAAAGYARQKNRLSTYACTASVGPGSTNMVTGAALATINRLPVLLLPGDIFATRVASPVLQELEDPTSLDVSVNDCFKPVSRFWDRINRPEQLLSSALAAMRVLTDPAETGTVTLSLPQDVQAEAFDWPEEFFARRVWHVRRPPAEPERLAEAAALLRSARRPLIVCGGGTIYAEATDALRALAEATGVPVAETQAGKGSLPYDHPQSLGAIGATGTTAANAIAREADVVLGVGTRWSDFTTASRSVFADPDVRFVNLNVAPVDAAKHAGVPLLADARVGLEGLRDALEGWSADAAHTERARAPRRGVGRDGRGRVHARPRRRCRRRARCSASSTASAARATSSCAPRAACPATCTSCGARATRRATTSSTASRAWATRSPAASASSSPRPTARST